VPWLVRNDKGHVDFVDAGKTNKDKNQLGRDWILEKKRYLQEHFSAFELNDWITPHIMTSRQFARKHKYKYEYIFIDGDHSYPGVKFDYETFWPRLATEGMMGFHDIGLKGLNDQDEYGV